MTPHFSSSALVIVSWGSEISFYNSEAKPHGLASLWEFWWSWIIASKWWGLTKKIPIVECAKLWNLLRPYLFCSFFFLLYFWALHFPALHHGLLWLMAVIAGVKVSRPMGWMTYMWRCELGWTPYCLSVLFLKRLRYCFASAAHSSVVSPEKLILVVASAADSQVCQAYVHHIDHMYCIMPFLHLTDLKLSHMNQQQRTIILVLLKLMLFFFVCMHNKPKQTGLKTELKQKTKK